MKKSKSITFGKSGNKNCPFEVRLNENGKITRKRFKVKFEALQYYESLKNESSLPADIQISSEERLVFFQIKNLCQKKKIELYDCVKILEDYNNLKIATECEFEKAVELFLTDCEKRKLRTQTLRGYKTQLNLFKTRNEIKNVSQIDENISTKYLNTIQSPEHALRVLRPFCNYCIDCNWLNKNPFEKVKIKKALKEKELAKILSIQNAEDFFKKCPPEFAPEFALLAFAGIRPMELLYNSSEPKEVLKICDIDFERKRIKIPATVAKTRTTRELSNLPDNLWQWIEPLKQKNKNEKICVSNLDGNYLIRKKLSATGRDIFRHSFGSYAYHFLGAEKAIEIMGHVGGFKIFAKHYKNNASIEECEKYFAIVPKLS